MEHSNYGQYMTFVIEEIDIIVAILLTKYEDFNFASKIGQPAFYYVCMTKFWGNIINITRKKFLTL